MRMRSAMWAVFLFESVIIAQAAQPPAAVRQGAAPKAGEAITITGCLAAKDDVFTLTAAPSEQSEAPTGTTATTPAGTKVAKTITYTLTGGKADALKPHVGHTVSVTGTEGAPQTTAGTHDTSRGTTAQGTSGQTSNSGSKPTVETTTQSQLVVRQLSVNAVKMVSSTCSLTK